MGVRIYFSHRLECLATQLATALRQEARGGDPFVPATVVVPNPDLKKWLQLEIARQLGIAANLDFQYLQDGLWQAIAACQRPAPAAPAVAPLTPAQTQLLVSALLLGHWRGGVAGGAGPAALEPLAFLLRDVHGQPAPDFARRVWQLAGKLALYLREYEFHRPELVRGWLAGKPAVRAGRTDPQVAQMEQCQMAIYRELFLAGGLRDRLAAVTGERQLSLPQFADEVLPGAVPAAAAAARPLHVFGLSQLSHFRRDLLFRLGRLRDLAVYQLNLCSEFWEDVSTVREDRWEKLRRARTLTSPEGEEELEWDENENMLLKWWGKPGRESLRLFSELQERAGADTAVEDVWLEPPAADAGADAGADTVLATVQRQVLTRSQVPPAAPRAQDRSLQLAACPSLYREVETVHASIVRNLLEDPALNLTDIGVLVPDMARYKPVISAVFHRQPPGVPYNLTDANATQDSVFGQAVGLLLRLATSEFSRQDVFALVFNPCFLAAHGLTRAAALTWVQWADQLHIYHSYDAADKAARGFAANALYTWQQGLERLRLGRVMQAPEPLPADGCFAHYQDVVPFADLASRTGDEIGRFGLTIELLIRRLQRLAGAQLPGRQWVTAIGTLVDTFLAVPADRPEEGAVRRQLLAGLETLAEFDHLAALTGGAPGIELGLVAELVAAQLAGIGSRQGRYLSGGVNVSELRPNRPVPFAIVYVLGLGEGRFPGPADYSSLDLRRPGRRVGDLSRPEEDRYVFLETLMSARRKLYLSYVSRDLQKDQAFHPCSVLVQLVTYLERSVLHREFAPVAVPFKGASPAYLQPGPAWQDLLVNYSRTDRLLSLQTRARVGAPPTASPQWPAALAEIERRRGGSLPPATPPATAERRVLTGYDLRDFLANPIEAGLRRRLQLADRDDEFADLSLAVDEPFFAPPEWEWRCVRDVLEYFVAQTAAPPPAAGQPPPVDYREFFARYYADCRRRSQTPDGAFGEQDQRRLREYVEQRVEGGGRVSRGLRALLASLAGWELCRYATVGEPRHGQPAAVRFPALRLAGEPPAAAVEFHGHWPHVWREPDSGRCALLVISQSQQDRARQPSRQVLLPFLFLAAARAGTEPGAAGRTSREFLGENEATIYVANQKGVLEYRYRLQADAARAYLEDLARAFHSDAAFAMLPFDVFAELTKTQLPLPFVRGATASDKEKRDYHRRLTMAVDDALTDPYARWRPGPLLQLVPAPVPADAWDLIQRRFVLFFDTL